MIHVFTPLICQSTIGKITFGAWATSIRPFPLHTSAHGVANRFTGAAKRVDRPLIQNRRRFPDRWKNQRLLVGTDQPANEARDLRSALERVGLPKHGLHLQNLGFEFTRKSGVMVGPSHGDKFDLRGFL